VVPLTPALYLKLRGTEWVPSGTYPDEDPDDYHIDVMVQRVPIKGELLVLRPRGVSSLGTFEHGHVSGIVAQVEHQAGARIVSTTFVYLDGESVEMSLPRDWKLKE
jgi:hypothetical protein